METIGRIEVSNNQARTYYNELGDKLGYTPLLHGFDLIHPDARIGRNVTIGHGTIIEEGCEVGDNVFIGHYVILRKGTTVGDYTKISHFATTEVNAKIGMSVNMGVYSHVTKDAVLEDRVFFGFRSTTLNTKNISYERDFEAILEPPKIEYGARIGGNVVIMPGVRVGREALIGTSSLVTKDCDPFCIYAGSPARFVDVIPDKERL